MPWKGFPHYWPCPPVTSGAGNADLIYVNRSKKLLNKSSNCLWFEPTCRPCDVTLIFFYFYWYFCRADIYKNVRGRNGFKFGMIVWFIIFWPSLWSFSGESQEERSLNLAWWSIPTNFMIYHLLVTFYDHLKNAWKGCPKFGVRKRQIGGRGS